MLLEDGEPRGAPRAPVTSLGPRGVLGSAPSLAWPCVGCRDDEAVPASRRFIEGHGHPRFLWKQQPGARHGQAGYTCKARIGLDGRAL